MSTDVLPADSLRRTRSTGDLPIADILRPDRAQTAPHRYSESSSRMPPPTIATAHNTESPASPQVISPRLTWSPIVPLVEEEVLVDREGDATPRRRRSLYGDILAFFGLGRASESRKELVSLIFNVTWSFIQVRQYPRHGSLK